MQFTKPPISEEHKKPILINNMTTREMHLAVNGKTQNIPIDYCLKTLKKSMASTFGKVSGKKLKYSVIVRESTKYTCMFGMQSSPLLTLVRNV